MVQPSSNHSLVAGTGGGTLLTILVNIQPGDIGKTALLASIGAVVSFFVSLFLKVLLKRFKR